MHQVTTDELRREYLDANLWTLGYSLRAALAVPMLRKVLALAARAKRRPQQPKQERLI